MLFRLENSDKGTKTHSGVLEFTAEEGCVYIPFWMMQNLLIEEGALLTVTNVSLPKATFVKLQPQHVDFLEISNPRAVLEHSLRNFSCVTKGDVICLPYNSKNYHFELKEVKPQDAACIIETDCNVDFDAPVGYKEPDWAGRGGTGGASDAAGTASAHGSDGGSVGASSSAASSFVHVPKQSAYARSSDCPSPTSSSMSGASGLRGGEGGEGEADGGGGGGIRVEGGQIIRPDNRGMLTPTAKPSVDAGQLADRTGETGVQRNAAVADYTAPRADYWAVRAGDGARLDGKDPTPLRDAAGREVDVRALRAEAAARRAAAAAKRVAEATASLPSAGITIENGEAITVGPSTGVAGAEDANVPNPEISKRKSRIGGKYSRLKKSATAFKGAANNIH